MSLKFTAPCFLLYCAILSICNNGETGAAVAPANLKDPAVVAECKTILATLMKRQFESISKCIYSMEYKNRRDRVAKLACIIRCVMVEENFLSKDGLIEQHFMDMYFKTEIPEKFHKRAQPIFQKCLNDYAGKLKPEEEFCQSYKPFVKCIIDSFPQVCTLDKKKS